MNALDEYLKNNRQEAYRTAYGNTPRNSEGRPVIPEGDEWRDEVEWDEQFKDQKEIKDK